VLSVNSTIYIYIYKDTKIERNYLMLDAYPFLRRLCALLGREFQVVDMRWGVRDERRYEILTLDEVVRGGRGRGGCSSID
jgi:hypothetical protein